MNNIKYPILKNMSSRLLILWSIFYIFGCSPKDPHIAIIPPSPKQTESVLPNIKKLDDQIVKTIDNNNKLGAKIEESKNAVSEQKLSISEALSQAERIKEKSLAKVAISELEALNLIKELKKVEARNLFLEIQNNELYLLKEEQQKILDIVQITLAKTEQQVVSKEEEVYQLREQNKYLSDNLISKNNETDNLKKLLQKEKEISASAKVYKHWIIAIVSIFIIWIILKNILMMYFPATKFRI